MVRELFVAFDEESDSKENVPSDTLKDLLTLQHRDEGVTELSREMARLPSEIERLEALVQQEQAALASREEALKDLETKRGGLELESDSFTAQIQKYKTQQLQVKKNEEYQALTHEIELTESRISELETAQLELMEQSDREREELTSVRIEAERRMEYHHQLIAECREKLEHLQSRLQEAEQSYRDHADSLTPSDLALYESLKKRVKRGPFIVPLEEQSCRGCYMRVSNDVLKKAKMGEVSHCDQCNRMVYLA